jgi:hypothetical protein
VKRFLVTLAAFSVVSVALPTPASALLCGNIWVKTTYALPQNCAKACAHLEHTAAKCRSLVALCNASWQKLQVCAKNTAIPQDQRCGTCTEQYEASMKPFFSPQSN